MTYENQNNPSKMIEMPEHLRVEATSRDLGSSAVKPLDASGGRFGNGVITIESADATPEMIRKAGMQIRPDTYVLPTMSTEQKDQ